VDAEDGCNTVSIAADVSAAAARSWDIEGWND